MVDFYLPDFGSKKGILVHANTSEFHQFSDEIVSEGYAGSSFDDEDSPELLDSDIESIKEVLNDWGWYGSEIDKPEWIME